MLLRPLHSVSVQVDDAIPEDMAVEHGGGLLVHPETWKRLLAADDADSVLRSLRFVRFSDAKELFGSPRIASLGQEPAG